MNEEQAVLDFFAQPENLPLALAVADQVDDIRMRLNNNFWLATRAGVDGLISNHALTWESELTEDRNTEHCLVGMYLQPQGGARIYLRPFMEQQLMGDAFRIYCGLMWSTAPTPEQLRLPAVAALGDAMLARGFKNNESFLAWQWTGLYPRRKNCLMQLSEHKDTLMEQVMELWQGLLIEHGAALQTANSALSEQPPLATFSLDQLRSSLNKP